LAINRRLVLGIVSVPMIGHTYTAIKGKGAFLNGDQVTVSSDFSRTF
jgi:fructose-1,6-bisphosphatase/inositol monophosphatase family enzyme